VPPDAKLLVSREEAAEILSLSIRSIDYLLASKELPFRKIGTRTMIPLSALQAFARMHHPERIAS
jgi:excisionase family DNA binding protein